MNRSIIKDQQKLDIQTESAEVLIPLLVYPIMTTLIILFSYLFGILAFKHSIKSAKESKKHSEKLSKIVNKDVKCYVIKDKVPNAFNAGGSNCYITKPLLKMLNEKETIAVLLHEYGHYQKLHIFKSLGVHISSSILIVTVFNMVSIILIGTPFGLLAVLSMLFGKKVASWYAKTKEFEADEVAVKHGYGKAFMSGLKKLEKWTRSDVCKKLNKKECDLYFVELQSNSSTHPPFKDRYEKILESPFFHKIAFYFASKISKGGVSTSLLDKIKFSINKLIEKIF
jgi:Zn-dependent protease with chaperone function